MSARPDFKKLAERLAHADQRKAMRLAEAGYDDLLEQVADGEIDLTTAMQIFDGRRK